MSETRTERLARIRAQVDALRVDADEHLRRWLGDDMDLTIGDVAWLLSQIGADVEYRVEWRGCEGRWRVIERFGCASLGEAMEAVSDNRAIAPEFDFRVLWAPVQVWTPVEEEEAS